LSRARDTHASVSAETAGTFPDENPNPVLRVGLDGVLRYANPASEPILTAMELDVGRPLPSSLVADLVGAADDVRPIELPCGTRTFSILPVRVEELGVLHLYGTDITARKVVDLFPNRNPFPVMRLTTDGVLSFANPASGGICAALGLRIGAPLPSDLMHRLREAFEAGEGEPVEVSGGGRVYALHCVPIPELGFTNVYGADVTAARAITKFPDQNPHPVIRIDAEGSVLYANPASLPVRRGLGADVGERLAPDRLAEVQALAANGEEMRVTWDERTYSVIAVEVFEFGFTNLYGTDITANLEVERLLLNILPASIAERLRHGEMVIADRIEEMTVLFADIVAFSQLSMELEPAELVHLLNGIFSSFDDLTDHYGLEKIKTIGDAYMVVGGLAPSPDNHCGRVAEVGLDMIDATERFRRETGIDLHIRVGMHVGPAVAGVVGLKKFIYDVWGETVNTASRMESHGVPDRIQVTERTYRRLSDRYEFEERGTIDVRGRGPMATWFLTGRPSVSPAARSRRSGRPPRERSASAGS
jgi:class 3 adenylate cyclase